MPFLGVAGMGGLASFLKPKARPTVLGGVLSEDSTYFYRTFFGSNNLTVSSGVLKADLLVVSGGGGGGSGALSSNNGGGGGAGGLGYWTNQTLTPSSYLVTVGAGGSPDVNGSNSSISSYSTSGGGKGAGQNPPVAANSGGSGGGGAPTTANGSNTGASGVFGQGNNGGNGNVASPYHGGGGGGAGAAGSAGSAGGHGGAGTNAYSTWHAATGTGISGYIAGGGGGGGDTGVSSGGTGGGGSGGLPGANVPATGTTNTGSGGGGGASQVPSVSGANGGSGVVIVRYLKSAVLPSTDAYELIGTIYGNGTSSVIQFTNIPQDYKHLQIRMVSRVTGATGNFSVFGRYNDVSTTNQTYHVLYGTGSAASNASEGFAYDYQYTLNSVGSTATAGMYAVGTLDIADYSSSVKFKTSRAIHGNTSSPLIQYVSSLWRSTDPVTKITLGTGTNGAWTSESRFSLYGLR